MVNIATLYSDIQSLILQFAQEKLVSGSNIKTINNQSVLGSGNISISGGGGNIDNQLDPNSTNPVENQAIANEFDKIGEIDDINASYGRMIYLQI